MEPFLDIYSAKEQRDGTVRVSVTTNNKFGELRKGGDKKFIENSKYQTLLEWASPVFRMEPVAKPGEEPRKGTAFHIGHNLVLTNEHVLDPERKNLTECKDFRVLNSQNRAFSCERVLFCNNEHDICLIKMAPRSPCKIFCGKDPEQLELAEGPQLKIRSSYSPTDTTHTILTAIGNSMGLGIHVTQGLGVLMSPAGKPDTLWFYASATKGNSGGPLLDDQGHIVGLIKQQSSFTGKDIVNPVGDTTYNIALRVEKVIQLCREALKNETEILGQFNQAVIE